jgi:hypothetical protein
MLSRADCQRLLERLAELGELDREFASPEPWLRRAICPFSTTWHAALRRG